MALGFAWPGRSTWVTLSLVPVVAPAVYLLAVQAVVSRAVASSATLPLPVPKKDGAGDGDGDGEAAAVAASPPLPHSLPAAVREAGAPYAVVCERALSRPVPLAALTVPATADADADAALLTAYLRGTMEAFSWTPQGLLIRGVIADPAVRRTFDADYLRSLAFGPGDLACGAYQVTYRGTDGGKDRAELSVVPLADRPDIVVHAIVVAEVERTPTEVVFVNETWMWRHTPDEKPTLLESAAGRWLHSLIGGWMLFKGTKAVTAPPAKAKAE